MFVYADINLELGRYFKKKLLTMNYSPFNTKTNTKHYSRVN